MSDYDQTMSVIKVAEEGQRLLAAQQAGHEGHDPWHMSPETCDHGRLLWQSCHQDGCDAEPCPNRPVDQP